jgi:hypothetical protein
MTTDDILELEWYFGGGAEADLGVRSIQSGFEATMDRMALSERPREWSWSEAEMPARETRSTCSASDDAIERLYNRQVKLETARRIFVRLRKLSQRDHAVLELQFGDISRIRGLSLSLLCQTSRVLEAVQIVNARRRRRAEKTGGERPEDVGPRCAVERLAGALGAEEQGVLEEIAGEAGEALRVAVKAYEEARS